MFLDNKYTKLYFRIIENAKNKSYNGVKTESHHIVPKSLGGSNDKSNIITLSLREHCLCHWILTKMTSGKDKEKMISALWRFATHPSKFERKIFPRRYSLYRDLFIESISGNSSRMWGKKWVNDGEKEFLVEMNSSLPDGYVYGRLPFQESSKIWITNGIESKKISDIKDMPSGYFVGNSNVSKEKNPMYGKIWIHNGVEEKVIPIGQVLPHGWIKGRLNFKKDTLEKMSVQSKKRLSIPENNPFYGKKHSIETINNIKKSLPPRDGTNNANSKGITVGVNIETGEELMFSSRKSIEIMGFSPSSISQCIRGKSKSHKGYRWFRIPKNGSNR